MNDNTITMLIISLSISGIILFIFSFLFMSIAFNKTGSGKYSFFKFFPYELNQFKRNHKKSYIYEIFIILSSLLVIFSLIFYSLRFKETSVIYYLVFISILAIFSFNILFFIKLNNYKLHIAFALIFYVSTILTILSELFIFTNNNIPSFNVTNKTPIYIINIVLTLFMLILLLNPLYKKRNKMVKVGADYSRPKLNYLAILEWGTLLSYFISYISLIISLF